MQRDRAKEELKHLYSELDQLGRFVEQERIIVLEQEKEKHSDQQKIERLKQVLQELEDGQNARQMVILDHQAGIKEREALQAKLKANFEVVIGVKNLNFCYFKICNYS